jgi:hypothetical protein
MVATGLGTPAWLVLLCPTYTQEAIREAVQSCPVDCM